MLKGITYTGWTVTMERAEIERALVEDWSFELVAEMAVLVY